MKSPRTWKTLRSQCVFEHPLLSLNTVELAPERSSAKESGDLSGPADPDLVDPDLVDPDLADDTIRKALVLASNDWVNVIALTAPQENQSADPSIASEAQVVLIRQWRFGVAEQTLEIPGGVVDDGEAPEDAARRELKEETGYECGSLDLLGVVQPNPALFNNRCHTYLAQDLHKAGDPEGDGEEEIEVLLEPLEAVSELVRSGSIQHALVVAAFQHFHLAEPSLRTGRSR